jgi:OOP family OmpA-OmpF porin
VKTDLTRNSKLKALITGYADKSGDPDFNAWISRQRAKAVRDYLIQSGISGSRLVMNFLGETGSLSENPADRRVEVSYFTD